MQASDQTLATGNMAPYSFIIENPKTAAPTGLVLDATADSGSSSTDQYTNFNNSSSGNSPLFDVAGVIVPPAANDATTVILSRATEVNGVIGPYTIVDTQTYTPSDFVSTNTNGAGVLVGTVQIADTNGGAGTIPDTTINSIIDTAPNQPNQYVYQVSQIDYLDFQSGTFTGPKGVIVDTTAPPAPTAVALDPSTDSGTSNGDDYTNFNNSNNNAPLFDVSGIEPNATVELFRTNPVTGVTTLVNSVQFTSAQFDSKFPVVNQLGTVQIADINGGNGPIPDSQVGAPIDTAPANTNTNFAYVYSAIQVDLAGNPSGASQTTFGNKGAVVIDGTDADNHGGFSGGANTTGWLYMQKVIQAIQPNITDGQKVLVALGADPSIDVGKTLNTSSAVYGIFDAFQQSTLPAQGWTLEYVTGAANITNYLNGQPAAAVTVTNAAAGNISIAQTGLIYIPTVGHQHVKDDLTDAELGIIDNSGKAILSYVNAGGGLYTQTETESVGGGFGGGPGGGTQVSPAYGWLSSLFTGLTVVPTSQNPTNIQLTASGQAIFPGLTNADLSGGPWHNYFAGTLPTSLAVMFTDTAPGQTNPADTVWLGLSSAGSTVNVAAAGAQVIIDATPPLQSVTTLDPSTDSGSLNNDQITNDNNANNNPPILDITNVEPNGIVKLYRTPGTVNGLGAFTATGAPVLVNTVTQGPGGVLGTMQVPDINAGNGRIPDGFYLYTNTQTDLAGNLGPASAGVVVNVRTVAPAAPTKIVLDSSTDSGTSDTDQYTNFNNSNPTLTPILDVYGIGVPPGTPAGEYTTVVLERAAEVGGVIGAFTPVDTQTYLNSYFTSPSYKGFVQIADTNGGHGTIADTPVNNPLDTAPNQPNQYIYAAYQIDYVNNTGLTYQSPNGVIIDSTDPNAPTSVKLDPSTDSGDPNRPGLKPDGYTNFNNSTGKVPLFDVIGIEPNATVNLFRTDPTTGITTLVNTITLAKPTNIQANGLGTVQIADINNGNGVIADDVAANAVNQAPPAGTPYQYTAVQIDLAGNPSQQSKPVFGNSGAVVIDGTDSDFHGELGTTNNVINGWLYMKDVINAIQPNITSPNKTLVALGANPTLAGGPGSNTSTGSIYWSFQQSVLPSLGWNLVFVPSGELPAYFAGTPVSTQDQTGASNGTVTIGQTGFLYITTGTWTIDGLSTADQVALDANGPAIQNLVNSGVGLYTQTETVDAFGGSAPAPYGWLSSLFPGITVTDVFASPTNIQLTPLGNTIFPGLTAADLSTGPWHEYFTLTPSVTALAPVFTDTNPSDLTNPADTVILGLSSAGVTNGGASSGLVTIDTSAPVLPGNSADPSSVSGQTFQGIVYTNHNNSNANPPIFDATNMEPFGQLNLYRAAFNPATGTYGTPVLVNVVLASNSGGTMLVSDVNGAFNGAAGNGTIADGQYQYTVQQIDLAGNKLPAGSPVVMVIDTKAPAAPLSIHLDSTTDTGPVPGSPYNGDSYTQDNNGNPFPAPLFDVTGVEKYATVELFRDTVVNGIPSGNPVLINSIVDAVPTGANNLVQIADVNLPNGGAISDGTYYYTAKQVDLAANVGPSTVPGNDVTIDTIPPLPNPPAAPVLSPASDTGTFNNDQITEDNNSAKFPAPIFFAGDKTGFAVEPNDSVELFRAPVNTATGLVGTPVLVNELVDTTGGVVSIKDINATVTQVSNGLQITSNGTIPDGTYDYYIQLVDLAGNVGQFSSGLKVVIDTTAPATPSPLHLDPVTDTGVSNSDGITQIVQGTHPTFDVSGVEQGATLTLYRAPINLTTGAVGARAAVNTIVNVQPGGFTQITDPQSIPDGKYQYSVGQVDLSGNSSGTPGSAITIIYDNAQPPLTDFTSKLTLDPSDTGVVGGNLTSDTAPFFDISVNLTGFNSPAKLTLVRDGVAVNPIVSVSQPDQLSYYTVTGGALKIQDPGPVPLGPHTYQVYLTDLAGNISPLSSPLTVTISPIPPGTIVLDPGSDSGVKGDDITNVAKPTFDVTLAASAAGSTLRLLQAGLTVTTTPVPANFTGGTIQITEPNTLSNGTYTFASQLVTNGSPSPAGPSLTITINTTPPVAPTQVKLDPSSDSGFVGDGITNFNNSTGEPLQFDATGIVNGATVNLYRSTFNSTTGVVGTPSLVNSLTFTTPLNGAVTIDDVNGPGNALGAVLVPDGVYQYTIQQVSPAGNTSPSSSPVTVTINTAVPGTPTVTLDPASNSGPANASPPVTNVIAPFFDVTGVANGATVSLYRAGLTTPVKVLSNVVVPANGIVKIQDPGPLANNTYTYTVIQTNVAGTNSNASAPLLITINSAPPATPSIPKLSLDVTTDTGIVGDDITSSRLLVIDGTADSGVVINLYNVTSGTPVFLAQTNANGVGQFQIALPSKLADGKYKFAATATNTKNQVSALTSPPLQVSVTTVSGDYNGASKTSLALFRRTAPFYMQIFVNGDSPLGTINYGAGSLDVPVTGDFYGTGVDEPGLYRPSTGQWFALVPSNTNTTPPSGYVGVLVGTFGAPNLDIPAPGNYTGTNISELGIYRPTNGLYIVRTSAVNAATITDVQFNTKVTGGTPAPADFLNLGYDQPTVFKTSASGDTWTIVTGGNGASTTTKTVFFGGGAGDIPVPGNYDTVPAFGQLPTATYAGAEEAVWQPASGQYVVDGPTGGRIYKFQPGDIPVPGDYGGLGVTEPAVYRPSTGQWLVYTPTTDPTKGPQLLASFGDPATASQFAPPQAPYAYRMLPPAVSPGISASSVSSKLNFGASAAAMVAPAPTSQVIAPIAVSSPPKSAPLTVAAEVTARLRPAQAATSGQSSRALANGHLIDQALAVVKVKHKDRLSDPFQNL